MRPDDVPCLGVFLGLTPKEHETNFWRSPLYRHAQNNLYAFHHWGSLIGHLILLGWNTDTRRHWPRSRVFRTVFVVTWACIQLAWSRKAPNSYKRCRAYLLAIEKIVVCYVITTLSTSASRASIARGASNTDLVACSSYKWLSTLLSPSCQLLSTVASTAMSAVILLEACNPPLPLLPQFLLHTACMLQLTRTYLHPAAHILRSLAQDLQAACHTATSITFLLLGVLGFSNLTGGLPSHTAACQTHAVHVWVVFSNLYLGLALPVYISYRVEQYLKRQYLLQLLLLRRQHVEAGLLRPDATVVSGWDVGVGVLLAALCWVAAMTLHECMAGLALPL